MDTLLVAGDHYTDARGLPVALEGVQELLQRALIRLQVRRGSFSLDPALGSELYKLRRSGSEQNNRIAMGYVQEALADMDGVAVRGVTCTPQEMDALLVEVELEVSGGNYLLEAVV